MFALELAECADKFAVADFLTTNKVRRKCCEESAVKSGILAPAGTPASIVDQLNVAINEIMRSPEAQLALNKFSDHLHTVQAER